VTEAYNPATNHWRRLTALPARRTGAKAVWARNRVIVWGGYNDRSATTLAKHALAFDPSVSRWETLSQPPMRPRDGAQLVWTGQKLAALLGVIPAASNSSAGATYAKDGAAFTPAGL
jgi:N-acetylneuraminic acid mutarotase